MKNQEVMLHKKTTNVVEIEITKDYVIECLNSQGLKLKPNQEKQFINICQAYNLNPVKKEIYAVAYRNNFNIIVGYEVFIKRAERTGLLDGWSVRIDGSFERVKRIKKTQYGDKEYQFPVSKDDCKAVIEIYRKDRKYPFVHEVYLEEYCDLTDIWCSKPKTMLKKVAIAQGFKLCFPDELGGIPYTDAEVQSFIDVEADDNDNKIKDSNTQNAYAELIDKDNENIVEVNEEEMSPLQKLLNIMKNYGITSKENMRSFSDFHKINSKDPETFEHILDDFEGHFTDWQNALLNDVELV